MQVLPAADFFPSAVGYGNLFRFLFKEPPFPLPRRRIPEFSFLWPCMVSAGSCPEYCTVLSCFVRRTDCRHRDFRLFFRMNLCADEEVYLPLPAAEKPPGFFGRKKVRRQKKRCERSHLSVWFRAFLPSALSHLLWFHPERVREKTAVDCPFS